MKYKQIIGLLISIVLLTELCADGQSSVAVTSLSNCQTQIVTLTASQLNGTGTLASYNLTPNQVVILNYQNASISCYLASGKVISNPTRPIALTGLTNISIYNNSSTSPYYETFTVLTPSTNTASLTPVNSVVIPSDATGNVQIILESSSDMVNWIPSQAGTYGSTYSNRFFRVRALAQ